MDRYMLKKEYKKTNEDGLWNKIFEPGDILEYNPWLEGWCLNYNVYQWQVFKKDEIEANPDIFEVIS